MLVKNFYTVIKLGFLWGNAELMKNIGEKMVNTTGGQVVPDGYYYPGYDGYLSFSPKGVKTNNSSGSTLIWLGSGTGAVTIDDYCLEKPILEGFNASLVRNSKCMDESGNCFSEYIVNITATKDITVSEIGFVYYNFLIDRTILETPLSLKTGQSGSIKYRITNASIFNV